MEEITKYGYVKFITGELSIEMQKEHLIKYGVHPSHIYGGGKNSEQTIFDTIASLRFDKDEVVVYSGAIIGKRNFKKINKEMGPIPQKLHLCKGDITVDFVEWEKIDALFTHIEDIERRNGGQGGKPPSVSERDHKRILKMDDEGMNTREITQALGWGKDRETTVWRWAAKELKNRGKASK